MTNSSEHSNQKGMKCMNCQERDGIIVKLDFGNVVLCEDCRG